VTFFVDANVMIYSAVPSAYRDGCIEILEAIARAEVDGRTSTAALEEVWYIERSGRVGKLDGLTKRAYTLFTPLLPVTDQAFLLALTVEAPHLGTNDRLHVGTCIANEMNVIVSADAGFDRVRGLSRVDPLDARSRRRLLASNR
jgi:predicted nucleic acid-binding protein